MKKYIVPVLIVLMWIGLLWSRALISISIILFIVYGLLIKGKEGLELVKSSWWLKGLVLLFIVPLISGLWSADQKEWWNVMQVKLPLLFFPFCLPLFLQLEVKILKSLLWILVSLLGISMIISLEHFYIMGADDYLKAKVMKVAVYDDHVRYSWLLVIGYSWLLYDLLKGIIQKRWIAVLALVLFGIYIHLLAAKTGLIGFYVVNLLAILYHKNFRLPGLAVLILLPVLAWFLVPSFQNRLKFVWWDFQNYSRGNYVEGLSDAPRVLSWKAAVKTIADHPLQGVGAGDIILTVKDWYSNHAPFLKEYEQLVPANQVLLYACYTGLIGGIICLLVFLQPLFMNKGSKDWLWMSFHIVAFAGFMYEIALEMQFGVFIYVFFGLLFYSRLKSDLAGN